MWYNYNKYINVQVGIFCSYRIIGIESGTEMMNSFSSLILFVLLIVG